MLSYALLLTIADIGTLCTLSLAVGQRNGLEQETPLRIRGACHWQPVAGPLEARELRGESTGRGPCELVSLAGIHLSLHHHRDDRQRRSSRSNTSSALSLQDPLSDSVE